MADPIATLIVDIQTNTSQLVTGVATANQALDSFGTQVISAEDAAKVLGGTVGTTTNAFGTFDKGISQADKVLAAFGVRIGPQIQAVRELGEAAGKSATDIGLIGTAGLSIGAGLAGWQIGRMISDYFELDEAIANTTATLMGWGDLAGQTAAAKLEMLSRASVTAGRTITDLGEAHRITAEAAKKHADEEETAAKKLEAAWEKSLKQMQADLAEIEKFRGHLLGEDVIANGEKYLNHLKVLNMDGLKPVKGTHDEIITALRAASAAMEDLGQTGSRVYKDLIAEANKLNGLMANGTLKSGRIAGLTQATPGAVESTHDSVQDAHRQIAAQADLVEWTERYNAELAETDRLIQVYNDTQTKATDSAVDGVGRVIDKFHEWHSVINEVSSAMSVKLPNTMEEYLNVTSRRNVGIDDTTITRALTARGTPLGMGGGGGNVTVNMDGMLLASNPAARGEVQQYIKDAVFDAVRNSRKF